MKSWIETSISFPGREGFQPFHAVGTNNILKSTIADITQDPFESHKILVVEELVCFIKGLSRCGTPFHGHVL